MFLQFTCFGFNLNFWWKKILDFLAFYSFYEKEHFVALDKISWKAFTLLTRISSFFFDVAVFSLVSFLSLCILFFCSVDATPPSALIETQLWALQCTEAKVEYFRRLAHCPTLESQHFCELLIHSDLHGTVSFWTGSKNDEIWELKTLFLFHIWPVFRLEKVQQRHPSYSGNASLFLFNLTFFRGLDCLICGVLEGGPALLLLPPSLMLTHTQRGRTSL